MLSDMETWREIHYQIAEMRNVSDGYYRDIRQDLALHIQENRFHRAEILLRLDRLELKTSKPLINYSEIIEKLWFKSVILVLLGTGNIHLIKIAGALFK